MSTSVPSVSWDNRPVIAKRRRAELYGFLDHLGIAYPPGAPKTKMIELLEANGINLNDPHDSYFEWHVIQGQNEHGQPHTHLEPKTAPHESQRLQQEGHSIDYDKVISERAELAEKTELVDQQSELIQKLAKRLEALEANTVPIERLNPPQLKRICKDRGIDYKDARTKKELLAVLEAFDGYTA